jgi:WD40 repeat protein
MGVQGQMPRPFQSLFSPFYPLKVFDICEKIQMKSIGGNVKAGDFFFLDECLIVDGRREDHKWLSPPQKKETPSEQKRMTLQSKKKKLLIIIIVLHSPPISFPPFFFFKDRVYHFLFNGCLFVFFLYVMDCVIAGVPEEHNSVLVELESGNIIARLTKSTSSKPQNTFFSSSKNSLLTINPQNVHFYAHFVGKEVPLFKCALPEKISSFAVSTSGNYIIGGSMTGKLFVWQTMTGRLLRIQKAHFKGIQHLSFSTDDVFVFSSGEDTVVHQWRLDLLVDEEKFRNRVEVKPYRSFSDHTLPVVWMVAGRGGIRGRLVCCSLDRSVSIHEIGSGTLLTKIQLPWDPSMAQMDDLEHFLFVGMSNGTLASVSLYPFYPPQEYSLAMEGGGGGRLRPADDSQIVVPNAHKSSILMIAFTSGKSHALVTGSMDGEVKTWDFETLRALRTQTFTHIGSIGFMLLKTVPRPLPAWRDDDAWIQPLAKYADDDSSGVSDGTPPLLPSPEEARKEGSGEIEDLGPEGESFLRELAQLDPSFSLEAWLEQCAMMDGSMYEVNGTRAEGSSKEEVEEIRHLQEEVKQLRGDLLASQTEATQLYAMCMKEAMSVFEPTNVAGSKEEKGEDEIPKEQ